MLFSARHCATPSENSSDSVMAVGSWCLVVFLRVTGNIWVKTHCFNIFVLMETARGGWRSTADCCFCLCSNLIYFKLNWNPERRHLTLLIENFPDQLDLFYTSIWEKAHRKRDCGCWVEYLFFIMLRCWPNTSDLT